MTAPREASVRRAVTAYLNTLGPDVCWRSNPATPYGVTGDPDLLVCVRGLTLAIELKRPGWRPTPGWQASPQGRRMQRWAQAGALCLIAWSKDQVVEVIAPLLPRIERGVRNGGLRPALATPNTEATAPEAVGDRRDD